jgi:hypothetical protein
MKKILIFILILLDSSVYSQNIDSLKFNFFDPRIKLYTIGEGHFYDNVEIQITLLKYLQKSTTVNVYITEFPTEIGKIFNQYVQYGENKIEVDKICSLVSKNVSKNEKIILEYLRQHNLQNPNQKIKVIGLDSYGFVGLSRKLIALSIIFPELKNSNIALVNKYFFKKKPYSKKKSIEIIDSLIVDVEKNKEKYSFHLGGRLESYKEQLTYLKHDFLYNWKQQDEIREGVLSKNLIQILDSNSVCVMICGAAHGLLKENDTWYYGYPITSMTSNAKIKYPDQVFSIIFHYYQKKLIRIFPEFNMLNNSLKSYFENNNVRYKIIDKVELEKHKFAKERCDMIIIQNNEYKSKRKEKTK